MAGLKPGMSVLVAFLRSDPDRLQVVARLPLSSVQSALPANSMAQAISPGAADISQIELEARAFVGSGETIGLSNGPGLTFEAASHLAFRVGHSKVTLEEGRLRLSSPQIVFQRPQSPVTSDAHRDDPLLALLQGCHPLVLLCEQPSGGSFNHCTERHCLCRWATLRGRRDER